MPKVSPKFLAAFRLGKKLWIDENAQMSDKPQRTPEAQQLLVAISDAVIERADLRLTLTERERIITATLLGLIYETDNLEGAAEEALRIIDRRLTKAFTPKDEDEDGK